MAVRLTAARILHIVAAPEQAAVLMLFATIQPANLATQSGGAQQNISALLNEAKIRVASALSRFMLLPCQAALLPPVLCFGCWMT